MSGELFPDGFHIDGDAAKDAVRDVYNALVKGKVISHSVDTIPYTEDFERLFNRIRIQYPLTRNETYRYLMNWRKRGDCRGPNGRGDQ